MKTIVIAPHADDELLGCGGTLIKRGNSGAEISWLLITTMFEEHGWNKKQISDKDRIYPEKPNLRFFSLFFFHKEYVCKALI